MTYVKINKPFMPIITGIIAVASAAISGVCVKAIKNNVTTSVEGKLVIRAPNRVPYFSAIIVDKVAQNPPTKKLIIAFKKKLSSMENVFVNII